MNTEAKRPSAHRGQSGFLPSPYRRVRTRHSIHAMIRVQRLWRWSPHNRQSRANVSPKPRAMGHSDRTLEELAQMVNPRVQGWINYYGSYYRSAIHQHLRQLEAYLVRWAIRKYKRFKRHKSWAGTWLGRIAKQAPSLFAHWRLGLRSAA